MLAKNYDIEGVRGFEYDKMNLTYMLTKC